MAIEYELVLSGDTPVNQVAARVFPAPDDRPTGKPPLLTADLKEKHGFTLTVHAGKDRYFDVEADGGTWEWEPPACVGIGFRMDKFADPRWEVANMLEAARRVLDTGPEDAAFVLNGDILLFTRFDGVLVKHRREKWWNHYEAANQLIPG